MTRSLGIDCSPYGVATMIRPASEPTTLPVPAYIVLPVVIIRIRVPVSRVCTCCHSSADASRCRLAMIPIVSTTDRHISLDMGGQGSLARIRWWRYRRHFKSMIVPAVRHSLTKHLRESGSAIRAFRSCSGMPTRLRRGGVFTSLAGAAIQGFARKRTQRAVY